MKNLSYLLLGIALAITAACGSNNNKVDGPSEAVMLAEMQQDMAYEQAPMPERKLIREGSMSFETADINESRILILAAIEKNNGYLASENQYSSSGRISTFLRIRVPFQNFDSLIEEISRGVKRFDDKNTDVRDVTEQFVDAEARLKTKKTLEKRYLELLGKANTVKDIIEIEKELAILRADIESMEGMLRLLGNQVDYATLNVSFYQKIREDHAFAKKFASGLRNGWENLIWFSIGLVNIWPFILIVIGVIWFIFRQKKRKANKKAEY